MFDITLSKDKTLILIDASYYVFYRYFATSKWYNIQKKEFTEEEILACSVDNPDDCEACGS